MNWVFAVVQDDENVLFETTGGSIQSGIQITAAIHKTNSSTYTGEIDSRILERLRTDTNQLSSEEWSSAAEFVFTGRANLKQPESLYKSLDLAAHIEHDHLQLQIKQKFKQPDGLVLTVLLGSIRLDRGHSTAEAITLSKKLAEQQTDTSLALQRAQDDLKRVRAQLQQLVEAKKRHDAEVLVRAAALLNAKKAKISEILGEANSVPSGLKRKLSPVVSLDDDEDLDEPAVKVEPEEDPASAESPQRTPQQSDMETADESE